MMPSRSTPNLLQQQQQQSANNKLYNGAFYNEEEANERDDSPPPAPPVRDSSTLKGVKYGPGHEKYPSWPVPSAAETPQALRVPPSGGSHRSKSWTDHTNYPKEKVVTYTRPYMKRPHSQTQQKLKTVMEKCEKIGPETYDSRYDKFNDRLYLPHVDRDGKQLGDADYMVPSPPERDTCKPQLTKADLEEYARSYKDPQTETPPLPPTSNSKYLEDIMKYSTNNYQDISDYAKSDDNILMHLHHHKQISYAQSEGYHSYVSSTDSTSTPFLDRLRRDSEATVTSRHSNTTWDAADDVRLAREGRDSVVTTSSGSASSSETLKWHGSMSDVSVASSSCTHLASNKQLIAHSARVQTPQRHHSESVLYMGATETQEAGWKDKESRNNNANKLKLFAVNTYSVPSPESNLNNRFASNALSVADRINELEKQQKYSYLDPDKKLKIPDPTLKAIQKKALLSFYERHHTTNHNNKSNWRSEPHLTSGLPQLPPKVRVQIPSRRASSASDYGSNATESKRSSITSIQTNAKLSHRHQHSNSCSSLASDNNLLGPLIVGPSISLDDYVPQDEPPPELPPKNPNLRSVYPDLFDQRIPSPDLPPPSPPTVTEEELIANDEPLPPPPADLQWPTSKERTSHQKAASQETNRPCNYVNGDTIDAAVNATTKKKLAREQLGISSPAATTTKRLHNRMVAVSQKVNGDQSRAEPLRAKPLAHRIERRSAAATGSKLQQRASFAEGTTRDQPPPLQPRQMRINQSMRVSKTSESRPAGVALRMSPSKDASRSPAMSQSKASYLASRRERERIVPDSDTGSYKRTISPSGHDYKDHTDSTAKLNEWNGNNMKNSNNNIIRRVSITEKSPVKESEERHLVLPDVLPINAKLMSPRYLTPPQLSLAPTNDSSPNKSPPSSPPKSPYKINPLRNSISASPPRVGSGTPPESPKRTSPPHIRPTLSPSNSSRKPTPVRRVSPLTSSSPLKTLPPSPKSPEQEASKEQVVEGTEVILRVSDASSQTDSAPTPLPSRKKLQEEIDCEKLSEDFVNQLPTSGKLKEILVQGPELKKPSDYVSGLFKLEVTSKPRPVNSPFGRSRTNTPSSSPPPTSITSPSTTTISESSSMVPASKLLEPVSPISATSPYFTTSEPKARLLTRYSQDLNHLNVVKDAKDLSLKKDELVCRLDKKLEVLRGEALVVEEECRLNEELGENVEMHMSHLARPHEVSKFRLHVQEVGKITSLLLSLSGRLARAENALMTMPEDHAERRIMEAKRDRLLEQLGEAKKLKESIDRRSVSVSSILTKYLNSEEFADYDHFINMKAKLIMDSKEIDDKIKLGEEQLVALKETLIIES